MTEVVSFDLMDARDFREEIAAVREGRATWAQAVEVEALCMLLHRDLLLVSDRAKDRIRALESEAIAATLAGLGENGKPRFKYSRDQDSVVSF